MKRLHIAYYITAHGYGHGVRSSDIIGALLAAHPAVSITVTTACRNFLRSRLPDGDGRLVVRRGV